MDEDRKAAALILNAADASVLAFVGTVLWSWLTPAPEPDPDEPTAFGAMVRDGEGSLRTLDVDRVARRRWYPTRGGLGVGLAWADLPRPITVILNDPTEVEALRAEVEKLRDWHVQHGMSPAMLSDPHKWDGRDCWCPAGVDHDESPVVVSQDKWRRLEAERDALQRRLEHHDEVASHATASADRYAAKADSLRARLRMMTQDRDIERRLGGEEKRRADNLDRALRSIERALASENLPYIMRVRVAQAKIADALGD